VDNLMQHETICVERATDDMCYVTKMDQTKPFALELALLHSRSRLLADGKTPAAWVTRDVVQYEIPMLLMMMTTGLKINHQRAARLLLTALKKTDQADIRPETVAALKRLINTPGTITALPAVDFMEMLAVYAGQFTTEPATKNNMGPEPGMQVAGNA
jgi:hypothetical protein